MSTAATADVAALLSSLDFSHADLSRARAAMRASREAREAADQASRSDGRDASSSLRRATGLYLLGRLREAATALGTAGDSKAANAVRSRVAVEDGDPLGAAHALETLGASLDADAAIDLVTAHAVNGDADKAKAVAAKIPESRKADHLYAQGMTCFAQGKHGESVARLEAAVAADPAHARALFRLAFAYDLHGEDEKAIEAYRKCTALEPTHVNALVNLGILLEDHDRFAEAEACYRRVLAADPANDVARLYLKDAVSAQTQNFDEDSERKEDRRNQILRTPMSEFELSVRSRNCLQKMEIKTLGDLITRTEAELLAYKNFGETSLQEIKDILAQKGLRLGMGRDEAMSGVATREEAEAELNALFAGGDEDEDEDLDAEDVAEDPRSLPLGELDIPIRIRRAIQELEIETVGDLADRTADELLANKSLGQSALVDVRKALAARGLALKGEASDGEGADVE
jgi:DNA-directed RNA polymerase subunit alpha